MKKRVGEQREVAGKFILESSGDTKSFGAGGFGANDLFCKEFLENLSPLSSFDFC